MSVDYLYIKKVFFRFESKETRISDLPFGIYNERIVNFIIDYYGSDWVAEHGVIIKKDSSPNKFTNYDLEKVLVGLKNLFRVGVFYNEESLLKTLISTALI